MLSCSPVGRNQCRTGCRSVRATIYRMCRTGLQARLNPPSWCTPAWGTQDVRVVVDADAFSASLDLGLDERHLHIAKGETVWQSQGQWMAWGASSCL